MGLTGPILDHDTRRRKVQRTAVAPTRPFTKPVAPEAVRPAPEIRGQLPKIKKDLGNSPASSNRRTGFFGIIPRRLTAMFGSTASLIGLIHVHEAGMSRYRRSSLDIFSQFLAARAVGF
jgi:hypothetical protein